MCSSVHLTCLFIMNMEKVIIGCKVSVHGTKREDRLVKYDMYGDNDLLGVEIEAMISFMIGMVTEEYAWSENGLKLVISVNM